MAGHVHDVVDTAQDPVEAVLVAGSAVAGEVVAVVGLQVGVQVAAVIVPDRAGHGGPGGLHAQDALDAIALQVLTRDRVADGGLDAEEWERGGAGLCWRDPG